jgi:hypothetical protein
MSIEPGPSDPKLDDLTEVYALLKTDASDLLGDLLRGISMWRTTAVIAIFLTVSWLVLAVVVTAFGRPYGSPPNDISSSTVLVALYLSVILAVASACVCVYLFSRYFSLKKKYSRLFQIAAKLR